MWALVENNEIIKVYARPTSITIGDIQYPPNVFSWSSEELEELGIYEIIVNNSNYKNPEYYINTNQSFSFANEEVTASYGDATARPLNDSTDPDTGFVTKGLKHTHAEAIIGQAYSILQSNDWYVVRETETGTVTPTDWTNFRAGVRSTAEDMQSKIDVCTTVDELQSLYQYNDATPPVRPLGEWPTPPDSE